MKPRVLIADDHRMLADAFERVLADDYDVVGTVTDGRQLLKVAPGLAPDAIVLDVSMPKLNGLDAARHLREMLPNVPLVIITMHSDPQVAADARQAGVAGFVHVAVGCGRRKALAHLAH